MQIPAELAARLAADSELSIEIGFVSPNWIVQVFDASADLIEPAAVYSDPDLAAALAAASGFGG